MINASNEFKELMKTRTDFKEKADITLKNGTVLNLDERHFSVSNNRIVDGSDNNSFPLGIAISKNIQIEIVNNNDQYSLYDFFGAKIRLYLTFQLSDSTETIEKGTFTVITPETLGDTIIINAVDDMYKAERAYTTTLSFPVTIGEMLSDICSICDIALNNTSFDNDDFVVDNIPDGEYTFRQIIGYIAMISGGNARIGRNGQLEILHYDRDAFGSNLDGGQFAPWNTGDIADGGSFNPWNTGYTMDGGTYGDREHIHILYNWKNLKVDTDDIVITGIKVKTDDAEYINGTEEYALEIENPLITRKEQTIINYLSNLFLGMQFRAFNGDYIANPLIEFMDPVILVGRKGRTYRTYITNVDFTFFGFTTLKNGVESPMKNNSKYYSEAKKTLIKSKELIEKEKQEREIAVEELAYQLAHSSGLYITIEPQEDGSSIYYMHDKSTLEESMIVWKLTALAFGISTDGGQTYPYGFTVDGTTITRLLYAEGINADYINTGTIRSERISLEGYTTINNGFLIDEDGNAILKAGNITVQVTSTGFTVYNSDTQSGSFVGVNTITFTNSGNLNGVTAINGSTPITSSNIGSYIPSEYVTSSELNEGYIDISTWNFVITELNNRIYALEQKAGLI